MRVMTEMDHSRRFCHVRVMSRLERHLGCAGGRFCQLKASFGHDSSVQTGAEYHAA
jgi:hypothetical protein